MADLFDMKPYMFAMIQFGPSVVVGNRWISLGSIEEIVDDGLILIVRFKSGNERTFSGAEREEFHRAMIAGAKQIESQIQQQQAMQTAQAAKSLGIIRSN